MLQKRSGSGELGAPSYIRTGGAILQRSINNVAVASDPSDVGGAPVGVFFLEIEYPLGSEVGAHRISAGRVHHALRLPGRSRGVEDVERMLGVERLGRAFV